MSAALLGRKVFSFEPLQPTLNALKHNVIINNLTDRVNIYNYGLLDREKCVSSTLHQNLVNIGASRLLEDKNCSKQSQIKVSTLDRFLHTLIRMKVSQIIVKIDIEESEPYAILGGKKFFETIDVPFIQMEMRHLCNKLRSTKANDREKKETTWKFLHYMNTKFKPLALDSSLLKVHDADKWKFQNIMWLSRRPKAAAKMKTLF